MEYAAYNKTLVIFVGDGCDKSPNRIVGREIKCFGDADAPNKACRKFQSAEAYFHGAPVSIINAHTASSDRQKIPGDTKKIRMRRRYGKLSS